MLRRIATKLYLKLDQSPISFSHIFANFSSHTEYLSESARSALPWYEVRGPVETVQPYYVPQMPLSLRPTHSFTLFSTSAQPCAYACVLHACACEVDAHEVQLEMLVTRTSQNTFVSASASQGINLLTMNRDDLYLGELLHFLSRFWEMVKRGQPPSEAMHWAEPERFAAFLDQTVKLTNFTPFLRSRRPQLQIFHTRFVVGILSLELERPETNYATSMRSTHKSRGRK
eukprot:1192261-Pleurochrysis_carterae.AAC.2